MSFYIINQFKNLKLLPTSIADEGYSNETENKMGSINNIPGMPPKPNKAGSTKEASKASSVSGETLKKSTGRQISASGDKTEISSLGRELYSLKMQETTNTEKVKQSSTISRSEIDKIKERIASNYYFDPEVIDKVVDKLIALPNYR